MMAAAGGRAVILDLPGSRGAAIAEELGNDAVRFVAADVSRHDEVERAVAEAADAFGALHLVCNCAGISPPHRLLDRERKLFPLELFRRAIEINLVGVFDVVRWGAFHMSQNEPSTEGERGLIVNVASIAAFEGEAGQAAYSASKGGVVALTLPLARDLARWGIRVMTIAPGIMDTAMLAGTDDKLRERLRDISVFPKRLGQPQDFARVVRCFMEDTFLNGEVVRLDAGTRLAGR